MIRVEDARTAILAAVEPLPSPEFVALRSAAGRIARWMFMLHRTSRHSTMPPWTGMPFKVAISPVRLRFRVRLPIAGTLAAGAAPSTVVAPGTCLRIFTGAVLPPGADAVVMQEDARVEDDTTAIFHETVTPWEGVRMAGEDFRLGARLVETGECLRPAHIGLLAAAGQARVAVFRRPRVALLATGSELTEPGQPLAPGRIYDSNRVLLASLAASDGIQVVLDSTIPDSLELTMAALRDAARKADVVVTTGGVSVGALDVVKGALVALGGTVEVWRVAMKPGKPFAWGRLEAAHWFGLPGNPVSAFVTWWLFVRPALRRLMGERHPFARRFPGRLSEAVVNRGDRRHFVRVILDESGGIRLAGTQASHVQSALASANALLDVPPETVWPAGREVTVDWLG